MESVLFLRALRTVISWRLRKVINQCALLNYSQIVGYGSQRARSKPYCLECSELLLAV